MPDQLARKAAQQINENGGVWSSPYGYSAEVKWAGIIEEAYGPMREALQLMLKEFGGYHRTAPNGHDRADCSRCVAVARAAEVLKGDE